MKFKILIIFLLTFFYSQNSSAEKIKINCKNFNDEEKLGVKYKKVEEEKFVLDTEEKKLYLVSMKLYNVWPDGETQNMYNSVFENFEIGLPVIFIREDKNKYHFGNAFIDGEIQPIYKVSTLTSSEKIEMIFSYHIKKKNLNVSKVLYATDGKDFGSAFPPIINKCKYSKFIK
tara:strand:+ start:247 stop:765 length:519 start_codon:yes stop_codon:yes gene_type:complete